MSLTICFRKPDKHYLFGVKSASESLKKHKMLLSLKLVGKKK